MRSIKSLFFELCALTLPLPSNPCWGHGQQRAFEFVEQRRGPEPCGRVCPEDACTRATIEKAHEDCKLRNPSLPSRKNGDWVLIAIQQDGTQFWGHAGKHKQQSFKAGQIPSMAPSPTSDPGTVVRSPPGLSVPSTGPDTYGLGQIVYCFTSKEAKYEGCVAQYIHPDGKVELVTTHVELRDNMRLSLSGAKVAVFDPRGSGKLPPPVWGIFFFNDGALDPSDPNYTRLTTICTTEGCRPKPLTPSWAAVETEVNKTLKSPIGADGSPVTAETWNRAKAMWESIATSCTEPCEANGGLERHKEWLARVKAEKEEAVRANQAKGEAERIRQNEIRKTQEENEDLRKQEEERNERLKHMGEGEE